MLAKSSHPAGNVLPRARERKGKGKGKGKGKETQRKGKGKGKGKEKERERERERKGEGKGKEKGKGKEQEEERKGKGKGKGKGKEKEGKGKGKDNCLGCEGLASMCHLFVHGRGFSICLVMYIATGIPIQDSVQSGLFFALFLWVVLVTPGCALQLNA